MNFPYYIARRIYADKGDKRKVSKPAIYIATAGVAIGLAVMIVSVCVIIGFKHTIRDKITGLGGHITVANYSSLHGDEQTPIDVPKNIYELILRTPGHKNAHRYVMTQGILKTDSDFMGVAFKGIDSDYDTTFINSCLLDGYIPQFNCTTSSNSILISNSIAGKLGIKSGDRIFAYFINNGNIRARRFRVSGIYQTCLSKFDESLCFTDLYTAQKLNGWKDDQISGVEIELKNFNMLDASADYLINKINRQIDKNGEQYSSSTVKDLYPQVFSWLDLLDLNVWIILALMTCVAGITIISGLLIIILERTNMIGILKALGGSNRMIRQTFIWFAFLIISKGLIIGDIIGLGLALMQQTAKIVKLDASVYYVNYVPVEINIPIIILINISTLLICLLAFIGPSYIVSHISPSKSIKYE